jgi:hypothetical protein
LKRTSGSASSVPTLSEIFTAHSWRPSYDVPIEKRLTSVGLAAATAWTCALISA